MSGSEEELGEEEDGVDATVASESGDEVLMAAFATIVVIVCQRRKSKMALKPLRKYVEGTDIAHILNEAAEKGIVVRHTSSASGTGKPGDAE